MSPRRGRSLALVLAGLLAASAAVTVSTAARADVTIAPGPRGHVGAFLLAGPFKEGKGKEGKAAPEAELERATRGARFGASAWLVAASGDGPIDVKAALGAKDTDVVAYAAATLRIGAAGRYYLALGVDDGVEVRVDGRTVLTRDESRPFREDDDLVALDLGKGDHRVVLKLHQRDGAWLFRARLVGADFRRVPDASWLLPGATDDDARDLAKRMSWVSVDRGARGAGYEPVVTLRYPEGAPLGVPLTARGRLVRDGATLFDVDAGVVPTSGEPWVVRLPRIPEDEAAALGDKAKLEVIVDVAGRSVRSPLLALRATREALRDARSLLAGAPPPDVPATTWATLEHLAARLGTLASRGDADEDAQVAEARELSELVAATRAGKDALAARTGFVRRAYRSPVDGGLAEYGVYVPRSFAPGRPRRYPLVVALHGYDGRPMAMLRWFFGGDDPSREQPWEERHLQGLPELDAFVVAPSGHGNTMYRDLGEDDVMRVVEEVTRLYPIDPARVTVTGPSMGGIGAAAVALHHPDVFAAAAPLCGYHSYFVRRDVKDRPIRPWERFLMEERSNALWAENGQTIPMWIVHGTRDLPEENSKVLIDRYEKLGFSLKHDHPDLGHNVWQWTYEGLKGARWLLGHARGKPPAVVRFRSSRPRNGRAFGVAIGAHERPDQWAEVEIARAKDGVDVKTKNVAEVELDPSKLGARVTLDGRPIDLAGGPTTARKRAGAFTVEAAPEGGLAKRGPLTGPLRDAFHEPLVFVYGASEPREAGVNEEVARAWARIRPGVNVSYPVVSDLEAEARGPSFLEGKSLFLVGRASTNRTLAALQGELPIAVDERGVRLGARRVDGDDVGAAFVHPRPGATNARGPSAYVVVVAGASARATLRSLSLPDLLPDFVVYDEAVAPARGQQLIGAGSVRAGGFFGPAWNLPADLDLTRDPEAGKPSPKPRTEHEATPYLP